MTSVKMRSPIIAGNFAVWSGIFNTCNCTLEHLRRKDDVWNPILSGAATGGIFEVRKGVVAMAVGVGVILCGIAMAILEGIIILFNRL
jgi:import inner membrane translocase subunit TIM17